VLVVIDVSVMAADNVNNDTHIGSRYVILAKHWIWLPDDGFM